MRLSFMKHSPTPPRNFLHGLPLYGDAFGFAGANTGASNAARSFPARVAIPGCRVDDGFFDEIDDESGIDFAEGEMPATAADAAAAFHVLARQPIVDAAGALRGHELLFRHFGAADASGMDSHVHGTGEVLATAVFSLGLEETAGGTAPLYVNVDHAMLMSSMVEAIDPRIGIIELLESIVITSAVLERVGALHARGFRFALDDVCSVTDERLALLEWVDVVKVDMRATRLGDAAALVALVHERGRLALAEKIEDADAFGEARLLGFDLFQGYFTGMPVSIVSPKLPPCSQRTLHRMYLLCENGASAQSMAIALTGDPALLLRLWLLAGIYADEDHPGMDSTCAVVSAIPRPALMAWLGLLLVTTDAEAGRNGWHQSALYQARFMLLAARRIAPTDLTLAESAYLLGLLAHFRQTLSHVLCEPSRGVRGSVEVEDAASYRNGTLGALLDLCLGMALHPEGWCPGALASRGLQSSLRHIAQEATRWARERCSASGAELACGPTGRNVARPISAVDARLAARPHPGEGRVVHRAPAQPSGAALGFAIRGARHAVPSP